MRKPESFLDNWLGHLFTLGLITAAVVFLEQTSFLTPFESMGIDRFVRTFNVPISRDIFLVEITDYDYKQFFCSKSPLKAAVLDRLLRRIAAAGPKVIAVDLDTSETNLPSVRNDKRFLWAEVPDMAEGGGTTEHETSKFLLAPVLKNVREPERMAMPQFPQDEDGVVRRFEDSYYVLKEKKQLTINSMACALVLQIQEHITCRPPGKDRLFSLTGDRFQFQTVDAREILSLKDEKGLKNSPFAGKAVLVGGRYRAARDTYITPAGELAGVEVIANAAQSYIPGQGRAIQQAPPQAAIVFDLLTGTFVIWLYFHFAKKPIRAFWMSVIVGPICAMVLSFLVFLVFHYWLGFMPVILGIVLHELYDYSERLQRLEAGESGERVTIVSNTINFLLRRPQQYPPRGHS